MSTYKVCGEGPRLSKLNPFRSRIKYFCVFCFLKIVELFLIDNEDFKDMNNLQLSNLFQSCKLIKPETDVKISMSGKYMLLSGSIISEDGEKILDSRDQIKAFHYFKPNKQDYIFGPKTRIIQLPNNEDIIIIFKYCWTCMCCCILYKKIHRSRQQELFCTFIYFCKRK